MGIIIILIVFLILGIAMYKIGATNPFNSDIGLFGVLLSVTCGCLIVICAIIIIINQVTADLKYEGLQECRDAIVYRLEQIDTNDQNIMVNGGIYDDIIAYNQNVRRLKKFRNSFWTNWFVPKGIEKFQYIEYYNSNRSAQT